MELATLSSRDHPDQIFIVDNIQSEQNIGRLWESFDEFTSGDPVWSRWIWAIGWTDVFLALLNTGITFICPDIDPENKILWCLFRSLTIAAGVCQGLGLLRGLGKMDDGMTLRYCELWIFSQVLVAVVNILEVFFFGVSSIAGFQMALHTKQITELSLLFTYRFVSFMTVKLYMQQLRDSLERKRRRAYWSGRPQGSQVSSLETWMAQ